MSGVVASGYRLWKGPAQGCLGMHVGWNVLRSRKLKTKPIAVWPI